MAYRQLCAVTFLALGLVASACGGGTATGQSGSSPESQPPSNADQAPGSSASDKTTNGDQAPASTDAPPANPDNPAGTGSSGSVGQLCQQVCSSVEQLANQCSRGMSAVGMLGLCSDKIDCKVPPNFPCTNEVSGLFKCFLENLALICQAPTNDTSGGGGTDAQPAPLPQGNAEACQNALKDFTSCAETNHLSGDMGMMMQPTGSCTPGLNCDACPSDCTKCTCKADGDFTKLQDCATACATP